MKYKILITFLCSFFAGFLCFKSNLNADKIAHIYVDYASTPAVFQMVDLARQPISDPKYILWRRFNHLTNNNFFKKNNIFNALDPRFCEGGNSEQLIQKTVEYFVKKNKDYQFVIHVNLHWSIWHFKLLTRLIPKDKIKAVYLYDDSVGRTLWDNWNKEYDNFANEYPVVFCLSYKDKILKKIPHLKSHQIKEVNFNKLRNHLSKKEKKILYQLTNFNPDKVKSVVKDKDFIVFIDDPNIPVEKIFKHVDNLLKENPKLKDMLWLYKQHPRAGGLGKSYSLLKKRVKTVHPLPIKLPFEILIVAGFNPKYVIGCGSSVFFSLTKEQVLGYVEHKRNGPRYKDDVYLPILKELNILDDSNIVLVPNKK